MTKLCFSLLLLTALTGVLAKVDWSGVLPWLKPPSIMPFGFLLLLYIPPIVMALQEAAPRNDPVLSLMAFGLNSWGLLYVTFDALLILAYAGCLALPCGLLLHAVVRAFRPGDRRILLPLTLFAGIFGMHRFYAGRPLSGFYMLLLNFTGLLTVIFIIGLYPLSAVAIWMLIDLVFVAKGRFRDGQNHRITGRQDEGKDERNSRSRLMLTLLTIFLGVVGAHRFLVQRPYTGLCMVCLFLVNVHYLQYNPLQRNAADIWWLFPCLLQLIWLLSDIAAVRCGCFRDGRGRPATA